VTPTLQKLDVATGPAKGHIDSPLPLRLPSDQIHNCRSVERRVDRRDVCMLPCPLQSDRRRPARTCRHVETPRLHQELDPLDSNSVSPAMKASTFSRAITSGAGRHFAAVECAPG